MPSGLKNFIFALLPTLLVIGVAEGALRIANFQYSNTPLAMVDTDERMGVVGSVIRWNNRDGVIRFVKDPKQLWVPAEHFAKGYDVDKPKDVFRIITLGDSCTAGCYETDETYPSHLEKILNENSKQKFEVLNAGVGSYSSFQGLQRFKYEALKYKPDLVTVYFGWNDHWISSTQDKNVKVQKQWVVDSLNLLEQFRFFQAMNFAITKVRNPPKKEASKKTLRVQPDDYIKNLEEFLKIGRENNIKVVLLTAPYDLSEFKPKAFFPFPKERALEIHTRYNQIVRFVANKHNALFIDLQALVKEDEKTKTILSSDGIHFDAYGCKRIAELIAKNLKIS